MSELLDLWERQRARLTQPPICISILIHLRDTATGDEGILAMSYDERYLDNLPYMFGQGNYSCDCNRSNFLAEAIDGEYDTDLPCNYGPNRIAIDRITTESGEVLYRDGALT